VAADLGAATISIAGQVAPEDLFIGVPLQVS
jgi:hypothetical protein